MKIYKHKTADDVISKLIPSSGMVIIAQHWEDEGFVVMKYTEKDKEKPWEWMGTFPDVKSAVKYAEVIEDAFIVESYFSKQVIYRAIENRISTVANYAKSETDKEALKDLEMERIELNHLLSKLEAQGVDY